MARLLLLTSVLGLPAMSALVAVKNLTDMSFGLYYAIFLALTGVIVSIVSVYDSRHHH